MFGHIVTSTEGLFDVLWPANLVGVRIAHRSGREGRARCGLVVNCCVIKP